MAAQLTGHKPSEKLAEATGSPLPDFEWNVRSITAIGKTLASGWLDRNYPFRGTLIRWYNYSSATLFGSMSANSPVAVGKEGWLFLARDRSLNSLEEHRAVKPLSQEQLEKLAEVYRQRRDWCAARGIKYLVAVAPNKESIYPELLPEQYDQVGPVSRMDQIMEYIRSQTHLDILDLRPVMLEAKKSGQVFYSTDSHWNARGAFPCYQAIVRGLDKYFPNLTPKKASDFFEEEFTFLGGDLSYMVGVEELVTEHKVFMLPKSPRRSRGVSTGIMKPGYSQPSQGSQVDDPSLPRAVFFHDSYFWELLPFLGEHFSRAVYVWVRPGMGDKQSIFDKELIEQEKPDVVVEEIAERFFIPQPAKAPAVQEAK